MWSGGRDLKHISNTVPVCVSIRESWSGNSLGETRFYLIKWNDILLVIYFIFKLFYLKI